MENEVLDTDIEGNEDPEEEGDHSDLPDAVDHKVTKISPEDVTQTDFCKTSSGKIMALLHRLYGTHCKRAGCDQQLCYQCSYVDTCLVVTWKCVLVTLGEGGLHNQLVPIFVLQTCCKLLHKNCLFV